ncbi:hypothetical protein J4434_06365 [Candidatus Woesearchaeota archaeon]|nr:hypothetical protein [Candidatus Woesearchaeota archaeon]
MNPFEYFQKLKPLMMKDEVFMDSLRTYAFTERARLIGNDKVKLLGAGTYNIHYRIGKVGNVWLATREYLSPIDLADQLQHCENYIDAVVRAYEEEKRVPIVCGGIRAEYKCVRRYFLLLEDLTQGGTANFQPAPKSGGISGLLNSENVFYDFDTEVPFHPPTKYLAEKKLLILNR